MIHNTDRSNYIGASDTKYVLGNWNTKTFRDWWDVKMGFTEHNMNNIYMITGNLLEGKILDTLNITERDRQIIIGRLRVNLDGEDENTVYEIKTFSYTKDWKPPRTYYNQVQVELFATQKEHGLICAYGVTEDDYQAAMLGETEPIEWGRLKTFPVERDDKWLENIYLPRLWYLCECLEEEKLPCMEDLSETKKFLRI